MYELKPLSLSSPMHNIIIILFFHIFLTRKLDCCSLSCFLLDYHRASLFSKQRWSIKVPGDSLSQISLIQSLFEALQPYFLLTKLIPLNYSKMKFFVVLFALIAAALAAPQFGFGGPQFGGSAANAGASSQTFK
jgi:hypothetical protein